MWFVYFHISLIPSILFTVICRDMLQSKAVVIEKWLRLYVHFANVFHTASNCNKVVRNYLWVKRYLFFNYYLGRG